MLDNFETKQEYEYSDSLNNLLNMSNGMKKIGLSEERVLAQLPVIRDYIAFWREYPDIFVDFLKGDSEFELFFYQRLFLRAAMRHRLLYATFPRAYSKSFLAILILMLRCILYPKSHLFVTTGGKEQAAGIAKEKVQELVGLIPGLKNEIDWTRGQTKESKDYVEYIFKNKSKLDILAATQASRGKRYIGGLIEEVILVDGTVLNEVIIPTMNVDRLLPDGTHQEDETVNKSQIYVTTAGWKNTFAYQKLMEILVRQLLYPGQAMIIGGTYKIPVMEKLLSKSFVNDLKTDGTYNEASFAREYNSEWCGDTENAFFSGELFDKHRILNQPEKEYSNRSSKNAYYIVSVDVGRFKCTTEATIIKVTPQPQGTSIKTLVNLYTIEAEDFEEQAIKLKKLYYKYKAQQIVIDANGVGAGLVDFMIKAQVDPETGDSLPPFGVSDGTSEEATAPYKKIKGAGVEEDAMYLMKANAPINTVAHAYVQTQMSSGKIKFLVDENKAKVKLMSTKMGREMTIEERAEYLKPFTLTTILKEQMLNLVESNEGTNIILKQQNKSILKDKFSALEYGLYYIKMLEDRKRKRHKRDISKMMFFS